MSYQDAVFIIDRALLVYLAGTIILIGLLLGWDTALGRAMARWKAAVALIFIGAFLAVWLRLFTTEHWRWFLRVVLAVTATAVLWQFKLRFGGWRVMLEHAWTNLKAWPELFGWRRER